jgi:hypothetical protein
VYSNTGVLVSDVTGVGTVRQGTAAAGYGGDKAIFGYGFNTNYLSVSNLVSNIGVVSEDTAGVGNARHLLSAASFGAERAMFYGGLQLGGNQFWTNIVSNTGVVAASIQYTGSVGRERFASANFGR